MEGERQKSNMAISTMVLSTKIVPMVSVSFADALIGNVYIGTLTDRNCDRYELEMKEGKKFGRCTLHSGM